MLSSSALAAVPPSSAGGRREARNFSREATKEHSGAAALELALWLRVFFPGEGGGEWGGAGGEAARGGGAEENSRCEGGDEW